MPTCNDEIYALAKLAKKFDFLAGLWEKKVPLKNQKLGPSWA